MATSIRGHIRIGTKGSTLARKSSVVTHEVTCFFAGFFGAIDSLPCRVTGGLGRHYAIYG
jgi:hypothetical protein